MYTATLILCNNTLIYCIALILCFALNSNLSLMLFYSILKVFYFCFYIALLFIAF